MHSTSSRYKTGSIPLTTLVIAALCILLAGCTVNISTNGSGISTGSSSCSGNCTTGSGAQNLRVFVEPDATESPITDAINGATKSIWLEMYLLSDTKVIRALEEAANRGIDVRVMLEPHPVGSSSPSRTMDQLRAAGIKVETTSPDFSLTHEKGMIIDSNTAFIMTSNFTRSALGGYGSSSKYLSNREYDIIDTNSQDVQAIIAIFNADWNRSPAPLNDSNLVVSPSNSRQDFLGLVNRARHTLIIEAEEMQDSEIEQAITSTARRGVQVEVILPAPSGSSGDSNSEGISVIQQGGVQVREDPHLYMHAKMIVVDGQKGFVGSENISTASLDRNRELGILISDAGVLNTLQQTFQTDWSDSQSV